jgi:hypothetical protein
LSFASAELQACIAKQQDDQNLLIVLRPLQAELDENMQSQFRPSELTSDAEGLRVGVNLTQRIESATGQICGNSSPLHNALILIAKEHGASEQ